MKKYLVLIGLLLGLFVAVLSNLYFLGQELKSFYLIVVKEETSRVKSVIEGTIAGGGDPVEALSSYMENSKFLKGATFKLEGREVIVPGSDISKDYYSESLKVSPFYFTLYFDFSYVKEFNRHLTYTVVTLLFFSLLFTLITVLLVREYFREKLLFEKEKQEREKLESINLVIHSLIHEVKNRLNVLRLLVYRLKNTLDKVYLDKLQGEIDKLGKYVEETANLRKPITISKSTVSTKDLINEAVSKFEELLENKEIILEITVEDKKLRVDYEKMVSVLIDLLKNAIEALGKKENKKIKIVGREEKNFFTILVMDSGGTLDSKNLFKPFYSTKEKGFGLGLYNAKRIVEAHGGQIEAFTEKGWTVFKISLPSS
ncbi:MAG: HAMP domain-containing sensor histidine kinase [Desulfurobacteriaceae bacterium]